VMVLSMDRPPGITELPMVILSFDHEKGLAIAEPRPRSARPGDRRRGSLRGLAGLYSLALVMRAIDKAKGR
jgi:hypothetical protein